MTSVPSEHKDPVLDCVNTVLSFYGMRVDLPGVVACMPFAPSSAITTEDMASLAAKLGFTLEKCHADIKKLQLRNAPAILFDSEGGPVVYIPKSNRPERYYKPGRGFIDKPDGEACFGEGKWAYIFDRQEIRNDLDIRHMKKGHALDWFWRPLLVFWPNYSEIVLCSVFINIFALAMPLYTMNIYDRVVVNFAQSTLFVLTSGIIVTLLFDLFFKSIRVYVLELVASRTAEKFDSELMERFLRARPANIAMSAGEKANIFRELQGIKDFYTSRLVPTLVDLPFFVLFCFVIYAISPPVVLVPITGALVILVANFVARMPVDRSTERYFGSMQSKTSLLIETLLGLETFRSFNAGGYRLYGWKKAASIATQEARKKHLIVAAISNFSVFITQVVQVMVVFTGAYQISSGNLTVGGLIAVTIISGRAVAPVVGLSGVLAMLQQTRDVLLVIDKIFRASDEQVRDLAKAPKGPFAGGVEIQNATFLYPEQDRPALRGLSLNIAPGEKVGLIGKTGAGKSTLGKLIAGQIEPQEGAVFLDGYALKSVPLSELNKAIGYVPQESFFFRGSIRENILFGNIDYDEDRLSRAVHFSGLDLAIEQTGEGLDMDIGENGHKLSGGQKQAVSLARVIIRDPSIILFDEPTTGMDSYLEERLRQSLPHFLQKRTFIMVTHRTSLLHLVDRLVLLDKGRIVADGPRDEIMKKLGGGKDG